MIHQLTPELLAVPFDKRATDIQFHKAVKEGGSCCFTYFMQSGTLHGTYKYYLHAGDFEFIGLVTKDGIDFDAEPYIESKRERGAFFNSDFGHYQTSGWTTFYKNYLHPEPSICIPNTPEESFLSLLSSKNISLNENIKYAIIKKQST